jgi:hypothetical protein
MIALHKNASRAQKNDVKVHLKDVSPISLQERCKRQAGN